MSQLFTPGGQSIAVSASTSVLPMNIQSLLQHHSSEAVLQHSVLFTVHFSHPYMTTGKTVPLIIWTFVGKVMSLLFNMVCSHLKRKFKVMDDFYSAHNLKIDFQAHVN